MSHPDLVAFDVDARIDGEALARAISACGDPVRVERYLGRARVAVSARDAARGGARWARCGLEAQPWEWPAAGEELGGAVAAAGRWWCIGRAPVASGWRLPHAVLLLLPVRVADALRVAASALAPRPWQLFGRAERPRPLARACARALCGTDGVVAVRAVALASGESPAEAREEFALLSASARPRRIRAGSAAVWEGIKEPERGGVWRLVSDLAAWWS